MTYIRYNSVVDISVFVCKISRWFIVLCTVAQIIVPELRGCRFLNYPQVKIKKSLERNGEIFVNRKIYLHFTNESFERNLFHELSPDHGRKKRKLLPNAFTTVFDVTELVEPKVIWPCAVASRTF